MLLPLFDVVTLCAFFSVILWCIYDEKGTHIDMLRVEYNYEQVIRLNQVAEKHE